MVAWPSSCCKFLTEARAPSPPLRHQAAPTALSRPRYILGVISQRGNLLVVPCDPCSSSLGFISKWWICSLPLCWLSQRSLLDGLEARGQTPWWIDHPSKIDNAGDALSPGAGNGSWHAPRGGSCYRGREMSKTSDSKMSPSYMKQNAL